MGTRPLVKNLNSLTEFAHALISPNGVEIQNVANNKILHNWCVNRSFIGGDYRCPGLAWLIAALKIALRSRVSAVDRLRERANFDAYMRQHYSASFNAKRSVQPPTIEQLADIFKQFVQLKRDAGSPSILTWNTSGY